MTELITQRPRESGDITLLVDTALTGLADRTATSYRLRIAEFMRLGVRLNAQNIHDWIADGIKQARGNYAPGIEAANQRLAAIRKFSKTAFVAGLVSEDDYRWIIQIKQRKRRRVEAKRWLTQEQVTQLMNDLLVLDSTPTDLRNGALIAMLIGCGLRRAEVARARVGNLEQREGRWVVADLVTKGSKIRTIGIPEWSWTFLDRWLKSRGPKAKHKDTLLFTRADRSNATQSMSGQGILLIVRDCGALLDIPDLSPHDLRRTYAQLSVKNGADIMMVQAGLGHAELRTTQKYLQTMVDFKVGQQAGDHIDPGLRIQKGVPVPPTNQPEVQRIIERTF